MAVKFAHKHYEEIAYLIREEVLGAENLPARNAVKRVAGQLARMFAVDNPRFNAARFYAACGIEPVIEVRKVA